MGSKVRWRALLLVLRDAWPAWLAVAGVILAFATGCLLATMPSSAVRYAGALLQVLGLSTVAIGLSQMRRLFDRPSLGVQVFNWFRRLAAAFTHPGPITAQASAAGVATMTGDARVVRRARPGAPLEERVAVLEDNLDRLRDELDTKVQALRRQMSDLNERIQREAQERLAEDQKTTRKIEEVAIGGLHLETVGLFWLLLGVLGTSTAGEVGAWLSSVM